MKKRKNKYNAKKYLSDDGTLSDSTKEGKRWDELRKQRDAGIIKNLQRQVEYELIPAQYVNKKCLERKCYYKADFVYLKDGDLIVEDVKSKITREKADYIIKRKLMLFRYGIKIKEV